MILSSIKVEFEIVLENGGYYSIKLNYTQLRENKSKHNRSR